MKQFLIGTLVGAVVGMCIGGVVVAKNNTLSNKISDGIDCAKAKISKAKDDFEQKIEECKAEKQQNNCCC